SKLKSSSAPIGRKDSWCFHGVGSSNAPLLGSTAAEGLQRIGRTSIATRWRFCGLPQSASCSENFVIPPDVFGQTLSSRSNINGDMRLPWVIVLGLTKIDWLELQRGIESGCARSAWRRALLSQSQRVGGKRVLLGLLQLRHSRRRIWDAGHGPCWV